MSPHDVGTALMALTPIGAGVVLLGVFGRDHTGERDCDRHDVSDYRPASRPGLAPARRAWPLVDVDQVSAERRRLRHRAPEILPPAPADPAVHLTLYAEQVVTELLRVRYGTSSAVVIADRWLIELGERARSGLAVAR